MRLATVIVEGPFVPFSDIQNPESIRQAVHEFDALGREAFLDKYGFGNARDYFLVVDDKRYDSKAIVGAAHGFEFPHLGALTPSDFSGGEATDASKLRDLGFQVLVTGNQQAVDAERRHRLSLWQQLIAEGVDTAGVPAARLRELGVYGGAQGIWVDKSRTKALTSTGDGVTVAVLHTGSSYADDLSEDGVFYHYPLTNRPPSRDTSEIDATKAARDHGLPIFVVSYPSPSSTKRRVRLGWVEDWEDDSRMFLISFGDVAPPPAAPIPTPDTPFELVDRSPSGKKTQTTVRLGQQRFKLGVLKYYGAACAVCGIDIPQVLDAAHIRGKKDRGSDDRRNGLVLCAAPHRAYDAKLFAIPPESLELVFAAKGPTAAQLHTTVTSLKGLRNPPHPDALNWAWSKWSS